MYICAHIIVNVPLAFALAPHPTCPSPPWHPPFPLLHPSAHSMPLPLPLAALPMACQTADPNQIESQLLLPSVIGLIFVVVIGIVSGAGVVVVAAAIANIAIAVVYSSPLSNCFNYYCSLLFASACCDFRRLAMR